MTTALTVYSTTVASSTLSTANQFATAIGGVSATKDTKIGTATGWSELFAQGTTNAWSAAGSIGSPSGNGWLLDATTLEGQQIIAGNWTPTVRLQIAGGGTPSITADINIRAYVRSSGGVYTQIGATMTKTAQTLNSTTTTYAFSATSQALQSFAVGDKLYIDVWLNVTANTGTSAANVVRVSTSSSAGQGIANNVSIVTPGYQPITNNAMTFEDDLTAVETTLYLGSAGQTESNTASDLVASLFMWPVDALVADDSAISFVSGNVPVDALTADESATYIGNEAAIEALSSFDIGNMQSWGVDALSMSDFSNWTLWGTDALIVDDSGVAFSGEQSRIEALTLTEIFLPVSRFTPGDMKLLVVSDLRSFSDVFLPVDGNTIIETVSFVNNNVMFFEEDLILVGNLLSLHVLSSLDTLSPSEYMLVYAYQADPTTQVLSTGAAVILNMWTNAWNTQAATKQHNQSYLITGAMYINWDQNINWSNYDQYTDINMAAVDSNMPAHGLTSINLHDPQVCLQYLRTVSWYKLNAPTDHTFDFNNGSGYMGVASMVDHVYNDFLPRYTSGTFGGYSNPKGWIYFALLDCYLNLQYSPLLTPTQITHLQQSALYAAWTYYNSWYDSTAQILGDTGSHTYQPSQTLLMCAALLDACQRWPTQITTGMFFLGSGAPQSPTLWTAAANAAIASIASRGCFNSATGLYYGVMNIKDGLSTDTINSTQSKLGDLAEVAQAYIRLYNLTGTSSYLTLANNLLKTLELLFWDNRYGGYFFAINGDGTGLVTNYKECRATAHMLIAYHMYNALSPLYIDKERSIVAILCTKMYKTYGGTGFWYRVNSDIDFSAFVDNYSPAFSSTLGADASAGDTSIQILSSVGLGKSGSIDLILDIGESTEEELAFSLPATIIGGGNADLASDTFMSRTVVGSWGTSDDLASDIWTKLSGTGTLSVNGYGLLASPNSVTVMQLGSVTVTDCDASVRFSIGSTSDRPGMLLRIGGATTYYEFFLATATTIKLSKTISGVTSTITSGVPGLTITAGVFYWLRFLVQGTSLSGKIWADGVVEPAAWTVTGTDSALASGGVGLIGLATTATPDTYDSYQIAPPPPYALAVNPLSNGGLGQLLKGHSQGATIESLAFPVDNIEDEYTTEAMTGTLTYMQVVTIFSNPMLFEEDLILSDIGSLSRWPIDSGSLTETALIHSSFHPVENPPVSETLTCTVEEHVIEALTISEILQIIRENAIDEPLTGSDSLSLTLNALLSEPLILSEIPTFTDGISFLDSGTLSDVSGLQSWPVDALSLVESIGYTGAQTFTETYPIGEALLATDGLMLKDLLSIQEIGYLSSGATTFIIVLVMFRDGTQRVMFRDGTQQVNVR